MSIPFPSPVDAAAGQAASILPDFRERFLAAMRAMPSVSQEELDMASRLSQTSREDVVRIILRLEFVAEQTLCEVLAALCDAPLYSLQALEPPNTVSHSIPLDFMREHGVWPIEPTLSGYQVALAFPHDAFIVRSLEISLRTPIIKRTAPLSVIRAAVDHLMGLNQGHGLEHAAAALERDLDDEADAAHLRDLASEAPVIKFVGLMIRQAVEARASDIHIEPLERRVAIRFRIDGVLQPINIPALGASAIISRIKLLSKLDIAEHRLPQDGSMRVRIEGKSVELRVSSIPTVFGESLVLRILDKSEVRFNFNALGFSAEIKAQIERALAYPHGIFLVTGPTGSGKSTTLYTALSSLNSSTRKIITVEDPVEHQLSGVNQIHVKPQIGLTFSRALRAIVRQDPDVIMIGEMRDSETAAIAIQSALTGHLVLSTLHTNDAGSSVTRLTDMGVEPYLVTSTLLGILAQRLIRQLCAECRQASAPDDFLISHLERIKPSAAITCYKPVGCPACERTGYHGRAVVAEFLALEEHLHKLIIHGVDGKQIEAAAIERGMRPMFDDGVQKVAAGTTALEELLRVLPVT